MLKAVIVYLQWEILEKTYKLYISYNIIIANKLYLFKDNLYKTRDMAKGVIMRTVSVLSCQHHRSQAEHSAGIARADKRKSKYSPRL